MVRARRIAVIPKTMVGLWRLMFCVSPAVITTNPTRTRIFGMVKSSLKNLRGFPKALYVSPKETADHDTDKRGSSFDADEFQI